MSEREYIRIYLEVIDDPKFADMSLAEFGGWVRLLMMADSAWPASGFLPAEATVPRRIVASLVRRELVDTLPGGRFRIHGLDKERGVRSAKARESVSHRRDRSNNDRTTTVERTLYGDATSRAEHSQAEQSTLARDGWPNLDGDAIAALEERTGTPWSLAGDKQLGEYDRLIGAHGLPAVVKAMDAVRGGKRMTGRQLIWPAMKLLEPLPDTRALAAAERQAEQTEQSKRGVEATLRQIHGWGGHEAERHPACPSCLGVAS